MIQIIMDIISLSYTIKILRN